MTDSKPRGFAALTPEQRREIARKGGKRAHALGRAHRFDSEAASAAGKIPHQRGTAYRPKKKEEREQAAQGTPPVMAEHAIVDHAIVEHVIVEHVIAEHDVLAPEGAGRLPTESRG